MTWFRVSEVDCATCGMALEHPMEYHPFAFCVLYQAGIEPKQFVREAIRQLNHVSKPEKAPLAP